MHQLYIAEAYALGLKDKYSASGTFEGVEFRVPFALELIQADLAYREANPKCRLIRKEPGFDNILTAGVS